VTLVIDASLTLAWHFEDEQNDAIRGLLSRVSEEGAVVPPIWRYEVANALHMALRRDRITAAFRDEALANLAELDFGIDTDSLDQAWKATLRLSAQHALTVYDASYLELAERRRLPLATLDDNLARAARKADVEVLP